ncbi:MAG: PilT/PilU family type 4a pilus ATPase [Chromatiales bacterium]|nr:PilT/PilU family type 4a pilus ATPase [Chromatiales bacterium]
MDFRSLLKLMVHKEASDLFITAGVPPSIKVHGTISQVSKTSLTQTDARDLVESVMTTAQREEFARTKECNFAISSAGIGRFRVSAFVQRDSAGMVIRRINTQIPTFEELELPGVVAEFSLLKRGVVMFVGPTGSGKSTSLAAMIGYRNEHSTGHIISIEDPIEYIHQHRQCIVTQREVGLDTATYEVALKNTLRQAPDVILIGEVRTRETMEHAIAFAETGHLVLTTLHANNANQAMDRIINFFPEDRRDQLLLDLSLNMRAIVAQQLLPRADDRGRIPAVEILINTPFAADLVRKNEITKLKELMKRSTEHGMQTFDQSLVELFRRGAVTYEDALKHADSSNDVRLMIKLGHDGRQDRFSARLQDAEVVEHEDY